MSDLEPAVPQRVEHRLDEGLEPRGGSVGEDQDVQIAGGKQCS